MMTVGIDDITFKFTLKELGILYNLLSEREASLKIDIDKANKHRFIELLQLKGKVDGLIYLIMNKQSNNNDTTTYTWAKCE